MILPDIELQYLYPFPFAYCLDLMLYHFRDITFQNSISVFRRPYDMITALIDNMRKLLPLRHTSL